MQKAISERPLLIAMAVLFAALGWVVADTLRERVVVAGDNGPNFSITTDSGRTVTRSNFGGKVLVLNFWATWCAPCIEEIPSLNELQRQLAGENVVVLGVSVDRNDQAYKKFLKRVNVGFQTARDPEANISASYGTFKYPETYVLNSKGEVVEKFIGPQNWTDPAIVNRVKSSL